MAATTVDALVPDDARVEHHNAKIGAYNYHYLLANPPNGVTPVDTILLCHGWPDLSAAWRNQVPFLLSLNLRVIVPDMLGYGQTSAPHDFNEYSFKKLSAHMRELVEQVCGRNPRIILGGHDWGGAFVWRMAIWQSDIVSAVFSLNVPYTPALPVYVDTEQIVQRIPTFKYQLQLASPVAEQIIDKSPDRLRAFLNGIYGGKTPDGQFIFSAEHGINEENLDKGVGPAALMSQEWVDHYVREFSRSGFHGPTNWYRTRKPNFEEELELTKIPGGFKFQIPCMVVMGEKDIALPPKLADGMEKWFAGSLRKEVALGVGHWAMWEDPVAINKLIGQFIGSVLDEKVQGKL
ncbi:Alpha/Beta hydrolase protein [Pseudomassariella vexata]|uniref:Alpha/Beta hydrolase protein n=1 Tax=Pseudomassariella vexata TaxID=1141098 RepID=A0A1Y2EE14_9PEZI|nr:Alpha/Beta hydrolase protein [Pseudomassariella vexata]ORY69506.1 Alpha/Beta hydrolase protein [Pseudomassariella vexata]